MCTAIGLVCPTFSTQLLSLADRMILYKSVFNVTLQSHHINQLITLVGCRHLCVKFEHLAYDNNSPLTSVA